MIKLILEYLEGRHERKLEIIRAANNCPNCDRLMSIVEQDRNLIAELSKNKEPEPEETGPTSFKPVGRSIVPWNIRRQQLERDYRLQKIRMEKADGEDSRETIKEG